MAAPFTATAQGDFSGQNTYINMEVFKISATIFFVGIIMVFMLVVLKRMLEFRLKNKIIDKGVSESVISSILKPNTTEEGSANIKWFSIFAAIGIGLTIINYALPLGVHSLAIMSFSIAAGFLGYHLFLKRSKK
jgi:hypothetical protein